MTTNSNLYESYLAADAAATRAFLAFEALREIADAAWLKAVQGAPQEAPRDEALEILNETLAEVAAYAAYTAAEADHS